jgi:hypothetical protein
MITELLKKGSGHRRRLIRALIFVLALTPAHALAAGLAPRSIQVGSSGQGVTTSYAVNVTTATAASIGSVGFEFCTTATGACTLPLGVDTSAATLNASNQAGFSMVNTANGMPYLTRAAAAVGAGTPMTFTLGNIVNPATANYSYNVRITTYTGNDGSTGPVDTGNVALSTAQPVQLTGVTPEILVFCVGTSITSDCTTASGSTIDFGDFSPTQSQTGTSVMQAMTNAANGYVITVNGTTLSSGANTIAAMGTQSPNSTGCSPSCTSTLGVSQFGLNETASGGGSGVLSPGYDILSSYRFFSGDSIAAAGGPTDANTYTSNYVVNIRGSQAAGVYTATMTYICTASF